MSMRIYEGAVLAAALQYQTKYRTQQESVGPRDQLKMKVSVRRRLSAARIDRDHPPLRVLLDLIQMSPRAPESMRLIGIASQHDQQIAVLDVFRGVAVLRTEHVTIDPKVAGLLLGQRVREIRGAHRAHQRYCERAARNIPLPAAAIEPERVASICRPDIVQPLRNLPNRIVPANRLEPAFGPPAHP